MKYFLHDANAFNDEKITELFLQFGYEGLGLFYTVLEKIAAQEKPIKTSVLKAQLKVGKRLEKCWSFMEEIGIISSSNGETFNERILSYSETYQIKKEKTREKVAEWRKNQEDKKNVTSYVPVSNPPKVKESKVKLSKEIVADDKHPNKPSFKKISEEEFFNQIAEFKDQYPKELLRSFYEYWREKSASGKMKFQLQQTWELSLRLANWQRIDNEKNAKNGSDRKTFTEPKPKPGTSEARVTALEGWGLGKSGS